MIRRVATIAARRRTKVADARLGWLLAWVAGAVDTAGFVLAQRYTSHVTGWVSAAGDDLANHAPWLALASASAVVLFVSGAAGCTLVVRLARRRRLHAPVAWPLLAESALLAGSSTVRPTMLLAAGLCFAMGWQNALATKVSRSEIRTTHVTGIVTDIGIGLGRMAARSMTGDVVDGHPGGSRLRLLGGLFAAFLAGTVTGAWAALRLGQLALLLPAAALAIAATLPLQTEMQVLRRRARTPRSSRVS